jgi:hypothetical protein
MSAKQRMNQRDNDEIHKIDAPRQDKPLTGTLDSEALAGIELTAARDSIPVQKLDDPYLVCFDEPYDAEKYGKHWISKRS